MIFENSLTQILNIDVGIYLGGGDILVSEQLLYDTQVGTVLQEVRSKTMPKGMRRDGLLDSGRSCKPTNDGEDHHAGEVSAATVEEGNISRERYENYLKILKEIKNSYKY